MSHPFSPLRLVCLIGVLLFVVLSGAFAEAAPPVPSAPAPTQTPGAGSTATPALAPNTPAPAAPKAALLHPEEVDRNGVFQWRRACQHFFQRDAEVSPWHSRSYPFLPALLGLTLLLSLFYLKEAAAPFRTLSRLQATLLLAALVLAAYLLTRYVADPALRLGSLGLRHLLSAYEPGAFASPSDGLWGGYWRTVLVDQKQPLEYLLGLHLRLLPVALIPLVLFALLTAKQAAGGLLLFVLIWALSPLPWRGASEQPLALAAALIAVAAGGLVWAARKPGWRMLVAGLATALAAVALPPLALPLAALAVILPLPAVRRRPLNAVWIVWLLAAIAAGLALHDAYEPLSDLLRLDLAPFSRPVLPFLAAVAFGLWSARRRADTWAFLAAALVSVCIVPLRPALLSDGALTDLQLVLFLAPVAVLGFEAAIDRFELPRTLTRLGAALCFAAFGIAAPFRADPDTMRLYAFEKRMVEVLSHEPSVLYRDRPTTPEVAPFLDDLAPRYGNLCYRPLRGLPRDPATHGPRYVLTQPGDEAKPKPWFGSYLMQPLACFHHVRRDDLERPQALESTCIHRVLGVAEGAAHD